MKKRFYIKLLTIIFIIVSFAACFRTPAIIVKQRFSIINQTEKYFAGKIVVDWKVKNMNDSVGFYLPPNESINTPIFEFKLDDGTTTAFIPTSNFEFYWVKNGCDVTFFCYNLSDTTVLIRKQLKIETLITDDNYWDIVSTYDLHIYQTIIDENTLSLFEKDYNLLDKFSEYYSEKK